MNLFYDYMFYSPPRKFCFIVLLLGGVSLVFFSQNEIFLYLQFLSEVLPFSMLERVNSYFFSESYGFIEVSILGGLFIFIFQILYPLYLSLKYRSINRIISNFRGGIINTKIVNNNIIKENQ